MTDNPIINRFRELCEGKMSKALRFMVEGLHEFDRSEVFKVRMDNYGATDGVPISPKKNRAICLGCAATCAIQKAFSIRYGADSICGSARRVDKLLASRPEIVARYDTLSEDCAGDLHVLETLYDQLRRGFPGALSKVFGLDLGHYYLPLLEDDNWREELHHVVDLMEKLEAEGK